MMKKVESDIFDKLLTAALGILVIGFIIIFFWSSNRGFDISDESYYLTGYLFGFDNPISPSRFFHLYQIFFGWFNFNIGEIRILGLFLLIISSIILSLGAMLFTEKRLNLKLSKTHTTKLILFSILGSYIYYSWLPITLSYNTFSVFFINSIIGLWMIVCSRGLSLAKSLLITVIIGVLMFFQFMNKFPNAVLNAPIMAALLLLAKPSRSQLLTFSLSIGLGIFLVFGIYIILKPELIFNIGSGGGGSHSLSYLFERYLTDFFRVVSQIWIYLIGIVLIRLIQLKFKKSILKYFHFFLLVAFLMINELYKGGYYFKYQILGFYILVLIVFLAFTLKKDNWKVILGISFFGLIGLSSALGTNNGLSVQMLPYMSFVFIAMFYLLVKFTPFIYKPFILFIALVSISQSVYGLIISPYGSCNSIVELDKEITIENNNQFISKEVNVYVIQLQYLKKINANYLFTFRSQTGLYLLLNKQPLVFDWVMETDPLRICNSLKYKKTSNSKDVIFILPDYFNIDEQILDCLQSNGINFPNDYRLSKQVKFFDCIKNKEVINSIFVHHSLI